MSDRETVAADGMIDAARMALAALDGEPVPVLVTPAALHSLVLLTHTALRVAAMTAGADPEDTDLLDGWVRRYLQGALQGATLAALGDGADADD